VQNGLTNVVSVAGGEQHSLALKSDGTVWAWGLNFTGQVGDGSGIERLSPVQVTALSGMTRIAAGAFHSLAIKSDGTVWAWGDNGSGQLGDGTQTTKFSPVQVSTASGLTNVIAVAAGAGYSLALKSDGTVWAWGRNSSGQLGDGTSTMRLTPIQVSGLTLITAIASGQDHSLARKSDGTVWAWGFNGSGQLGDGTFNPTLNPAQVGGLSGISAIAAGGSHSLALKSSDGSVWGWGRNTEGQVGNGGGGNQLVPAQATGLTGVRAIAGGGYHSLAIR
jgi:alpha-tubulin suppressor-like RCC1 family protein